MKYEPVLNKIIMKASSSAKTLEQTFMNPLNKSTSKQQFTFSKQPRFPHRSKTQAADTFYEIPSTRSRIASSFGQANKSLARILNKNPDPTAYNIQGSFEKILSKKFGNSFLYGREECRSNSVFRLSKNPGPGEYNPNPEFIDSRLDIKFSIGKELRLHQFSKDNEVPGPGSYKINSGLLDKDKILSNDKKANIGKIFSESKSSRRLKGQSELTFPSIIYPQVTYRGENLIRTDKGFSLPKAKRFQMQQQETPPPGTYNQFSEFIDNIKLQRT